MIRVAELPLDFDLSAVNHHLRQLGLRFRITEEAGQQVIFAASPDEATHIQRVLSDPNLDLRLQQSGMRKASPVTAASTTGRGFIATLRTTPITAFLAASCLVVAAVSGLGRQLDSVAFLFYPLLPTESFAALLLAVDSPLVALRTLTPALLHFGELHLVFNLMWLLYFGRQLERLQSPAMYLFLIVFTAFISNTAQYLAIGYNNFGGMSGVVCGLVGYTWTIHALMPRSYVDITNSMFMVFVVVLVIMELLASSWIASAAHFGGLLLGLLLGGLVVAIYRFVLGRQAVGSLPQPRSRS